MSAVAIRVEGLGKRYRIGTAAERHESLRDAIAHAFAAPFRNLRNLRRLSSFEERDADDVVWALKDVSFEVPRGEAMGIIGRNGAGKSTLLKILSRITDPSAGRAEVFGRVGSLLEVGTGFHPELSGRENVYLNGSILGMDRAYIDRRFDEIVAFSGVERYIDTPVKRYSSGMYLRLAFAVAAHLEPEIMVVDEVLAVGDAEFQKKCLGKMGEVAGEGRTVLFVSHQMAAIQNLCKHALWMERGRVKAEGPTGSIISQYLSHSVEVASSPLATRKDRQGSGEVRFSSVLLTDEHNRPVTSLRTGEYARLAIRFDRKVAGQELQNVHIASEIDNREGVRIAYLFNDLTGDLFPSIPADCSAIYLDIPRLPLTPGRYSLSLFVSVNGVIADWIQRDAVSIDVEPGDFYRTGRLPPDNQGSIVIDHRFALAEEPASSALVGR